MHVAERIVFLHPKLMICRYFLPLLLFCHFAGRKLEVMLSGQHIPQEDSFWLQKAAKKIRQLKRRHRRRSIDRVPRLTQRKGPKRSGIHFSSRRARLFETPSFTIHAAATHRANPTAFVASCWERTRRRSAKPSPCAAPKIGRTPTATSSRPSASGQNPSSPAQPPINASCTYAQPPSTSCSQDRLSPPSLSAPSWRRVQRPPLPTWRPPPVRRRHRRARGF